MDHRDVAIGIATLNGPDRIRRCLRSIAEHTDLEEHRAAIVVCDDHSAPENVVSGRKATEDRGAVFLANEARSGVAASWNRIARHGTDVLGASCIVLLNDDVEVRPDWLDALVFSVRENPHAGMVGLNAWQGVNSENFTPPRPLDYNEAVMTRGHGMLSSCGYCFAFTADKYLAVGGFDQRYFCFYEELDMGCALLSRGWPSYMLTYPAVIHQGGATTSMPENIDAQARLIESRAKFQEKWGGIEAQRALILGRRWPDCVNWNTTLKRHKV